jgi:hypothetical protein
LTEHIPDICRALFLDQGKVCRFQRLMLEW